MIDDLKIMPSNANMKCYVHNNFNKRVVAILDENHLATFMEYSNEGKLTRLKKETSKGILTIKESRESLKNYFINAGGAVISYPPLENY